MSLIKMMLVMVSVAAISKTFGLLRFLLRLSFLAKDRKSGSAGMPRPISYAVFCLKKKTNKTPTTKQAKKAIKDFGVRKGEPIAAVVTLRGKDAGEFLKRALEAVSNKVNESSFDDYGNFSFGIKDHIEIPGTRYVP